MKDTVEYEIDTEKETKNEKAKKTFLLSLFSDREWDSDLTKVLGFSIVVAGLVGFFMGKNDFQWIVAFGSGLVATGKFSKEG